VANRIDKLQLALHVVSCSSMERVGIRELKQNASAVVRRVARGESLEVTEHGRPVARLVPILPAGGIEQLIVEGKVELPVEDGNLADIEPLPQMPGRPSLYDVLMDLRTSER
jgi:prevent-host-death family protein